MKLECNYISAGCNRSPNCLSCRGDRILYASCNAVVLAKKTPEALIAEKTFAAHNDRVNCVRWLSDHQFVSCSTDKSIIVWQEDPNAPGDFEPRAIGRDHAKPVTVVAGLGDVMLASASGDLTIRIWRLEPGQDQLKCIQVITNTRNRVSVELKLFWLAKDMPILLAAMDDCKVHLFLPNEEDVFDEVHTLSGHEGWVHGIDICRVDTNDLFIATCGQDSYIRIWRLSPQSDEEAKRQRKATAELGQDEEITVKKDVMQCRGSGFTVTLETILSGHEDKVYSVQFGQINGDLRLLTSSMDKTLIVWTPPDKGTNSDDEIWNESLRVGEVGGNVLGFLGAQFVGQDLLGYSFNGAFHGWTQPDLKGAWQPFVVTSGHFGPVEGLAWQRKGRYFLTLGADQTTRAHAKWRTKECQSIWREVGRPQVHGHDLVALTMLDGHRFASGAEEKVVRVFEATKIFLENWQSITGQQLGAEDLAQAQGASVPSLGLSNKAVFEGQADPGPEEAAARHVKDQYPDFYFKPEQYQVPPPEEALVQNTLWPELQKLYGHGYEIFCLSSCPDGSVLASACKASKAEHAEIILWDTSTWKIRQKLAGHGLTVTTMEFSPCGSFLLSGSRDRTWCLFERQEDNRFEKVANTDKSNSVHQRLIWSCSWSADSKYFVTSSRDKKVAIWTKTGKESHSSLGQFGLACQAPLILDESVTAVAFSPRISDAGYTLAAGLDDGSIVLIQWQSDGQDQEWHKLETLDQSQAHHKTVTKLAFCPDATDDLIAASCARDHAVKLFKLCSS